MTRCPVCTRPATRLQPSPTTDPHVVAVYPCGCWITPRQARTLADTTRRTEETP